MEDLAKLPKTAAILVADDLNEMRQMISETFQSQGFNKVIEARNGEDAFQKIKAKGVALAIVDLNMPKVDGLELIKKMRTDLFTKTIPIIVITAHAEQARVVEAIIAGANDFIAKPFNPELLMSKVKKLCR